MEDVGRELKKIISKRNYQEKYAEMIQEVLNDSDVQSFLAEHQERLTQADIEKSYAKLYEFVQEKRKYQKNDPTMIAPGYEPKLVLNFHYVDVTYVPTEALIARQKQEEIRSRVKAMDMPKDIQTATFEGFEQTSGRSDAFFEAFNFVEQYTKDPKGYHKGLYLVGSFGIGKTYLLGAIAHDLAVAGYTTTLVHFPTFAVEMKQAIGKDQVSDKLDAVKRSPILMMDDIGADAMSSWIRDEVFGVILQYRMQEQLPTFFSSNFTMDELEKHLSVTQRGDEEPLKAKRIMERIRYLTKEIEMTGKNRRNG
ncbi:MULTISPECIES: primosomal protein DnaI [Enterococcus]|uniref:primosomal protein DnaI n=1 Tax=Enterococcus TaxID=1350 RepID=UPI00288DAFD3|nr:primosomal protein DnaI [Enterococcus thailandicus]MDT2752146.1 primosomal protein DnaI [Enterococcus thailandicus]MDT2776976.1 primosomal protein DnaI [Enterococcus thailandicus]MDT2793951.1 primosomal protein DnaI [Enterococcus thailandicus]